MLIYSELKIEDKNITGEQDKEKLVDKLYDGDLTSIGNIVFIGLWLSIEEEFLKEIENGNLCSSNTTSLLIYILQKEENTYILCA